MDTDEPGPFGVFEPQNMRQSIFMVWIDRLSDLIVCAAKRKELTLDMAGKLREMVTQEVFRAYQKVLAAEGIEDIEAFCGQIIEPMEEPFLQQNDTQIASLDDSFGFGPSQALKHYEDLIFGQVGEVPDDELQAMLDASKGKGLLFEASQEYLSRIIKVAKRLRQAGFAPRDIAEEDLVDRLHALAITAAMENTGPARRKKAGPKAGESKKIDYAFSFNLARENVRKWPEKYQRQQSTTDKDCLGPEEIDRLIALANDCCTPTEFECIKLRYECGMTYQAIAERRGVRRSTVQRCIGNAEKKIRPYLQVG